MTKLTFRTFVSILAVLLAMGATALAQDVITADDFDWDQYEPYGEFEFTYDAYDDAELGAIILRHSTPTDQEANFDVVGPNDYWEHFDFSDNTGEQFVLDDLPPGIYSIAATDEGLQLAHTVVEVRVGEVVDVFVNMQVWEAGVFETGAYDPYSYYGAYEGYEDAYPGYPYGAYTVSPYSPYDVADAGALAITNVPVGHDVVVTGPNGFSEGYEEAVVVESLPPGLYAVAASGEGSDTTVTTVEIQGGQQLSLEPMNVALQ